MTMVMMKNSSDDHPAFFVGCKEYKFVKKSYYDDDDFCVFHHHNLNTYKYKSNTKKSRKRQKWTTHCCYKKNKSMCKYTMMKTKLKKMNNSNHIHKQNM